VFGSLDELESRLEGDFAFGSQTEVEIRHFAALIRFNAA
jgi:glutathionyl-hydroquinone reductase